MGCTVMGNNFNPGEFEPRTNTRNCNGFAWLDKELLDCFIIMIVFKYYSTRVRTDYVYYSTTGTVATRLHPFHRFTCSKYNTIALHELNSLSFQQFSNSR
jgi:hypothetical protein